MLMNSGLFKTKNMRYFLIIFLFLVVGCSQTEKHENAVLVKELWSKENISHNNYRIPSMVVSQQNTLLAFAEGREGGDSGDIDILLKRSTDNGISWGQQIIVWDDSDNSCGNPCPVIDRNTGRIILFMTWNLGTDIEHQIIRKESENTRIPYMTYSDDDGITWSEPKNLLDSAKDKDWGWFATGPGIGIQLESEKYKGRLVIPCNYSYTEPDNIERDGFEYGSLTLFSDNGGVSWQRSEMITPAVNESQVVELSNGTLIMNMRSYSGKSCRAISYSYDGGETWSEVRNNPQLVESVCQGSIISFGNFEDKNLYLFSNPAVAFNRTHMTIKTSFDECVNWSNSKLIYSGPSAYSCLTKLPNGNIGLFFECGEQSPYEKMIFVSIEPKELFTSDVVVNSLEFN
jgi:sialidase-1